MAAVADRPQGRFIQLSVAAAAAAGGGARC